MQKGKNFHFNIIDFLVILLVAFIIIAFAFYATGKWRSEASSDNVSNASVKYTLFVKTVEPHVCDLIQAGDELRDSAKDTVKGKISNIISTEKYVDYEAYNTEDGVLNPSTHPYYYSVEVEIESPCVINNGTAYIEDMEIKVGEQITLKSSKYVLPGYIIAVEKSMQ